MAKYANGVSEKKRLGIRFLAIVPQQMVLGTGVGDAGANAYAHAMGMKPEEFVARFGAPMPPREFGGELFPCWTAPNMRALDLLRGREVRLAEPIDAAADIANSAQADPLEMLMRKEAVENRGVAVCGASRPPAQRRHPEGHLATR